MKPRFQHFEYFYGFIGGESNQYYPALYEDTTPIEAPKTPGQGYHFTEDMTDKAMKWGGDAKDADHYIKPEERLRLVMALQ